jgi:hypothetical protein
VILSAAKVGFGSSFLTAVSLAGTAVFLLVFSASRGGPGTTWKSNCLEQEEADVLQESCSRDAAYGDVGFGAG